MWGFVLYTFVGKPFSIIKKRAAELLTQFPGVFLPRFSSRLAKGIGGFLLEDWMSIWLSGVLPIYFFPVVIEKREPAFWSIPDKR